MEQQQHRRILQHHNGEEYDYDDFGQPRQYLQHLQQQQYPDGDNNAGYAAMRRRQEHIKLAVWSEQLRHQQDLLRQQEELLRQRRSQVTLTRTKRALDDAEMDFLFSSLDKRN